MGVVSLSLLCIVKKCFIYFQFEIWWDPRIWSVANKMYVDICAVNSLPKMNFPRLERLYQTQQLKVASKISSFKIHSSNCSFKTALFPDFNLQILSSKSNIRSSFANFFNFKFSKSCWKSPKLCKGILAHFGKMSLVRWFWALFFFVNKKGSVLLRKMG